jgi:NodT family efflux transporter outer membrane factor (OMF) lipoprotein
MKNNKLLLTLVTSAVFFIQGCAISHLDADKQMPELPSKWQTEFTENDIDENWVAVFTDSNTETSLATMIDEALQNNQAIRSGSFNVKVAEQQLLIAESNFWPSLDLGFSANRSKSSGSISNRFDLDADLSFELDLWGALSDAEQQAKLNYLSAQASLTESKLQLVGDVLSAYANASRAHQRVLLAAQQVQNSQANLDIIERGYRAGLNESLDVYLARNELNSDISSLAQNRQTLIENKRTLERLLGRYPSGEINVSTELSLPNESLGLGIPSAVITRKPALQASWFALMAQDAELAIAHKARFPSLNISASFGPSSDSISNLLSASSGWSLLGGISAPLFNAGRLQANQEIELLTLKALEESYLDSVFTTLLAVENALSQERTLLARYEATLTAQENAKIANQLSFEQYQLGLVTYTTVLEAQTRLLTAQNNLIDIQTDLIINRIELHVSLGAGANFDANIQTIEL